MGANNRNHGAFPGPGEEADENNTCLSFAVCRPVSKGVA